MRRVEATVRGLWSIRFNQKPPPLLSKHPSLALPLKFPFKKQWLGLKGAPWAQSRLKTSCEVQETGGEPFTDPPPCHIHILHLSGSGSGSPLALPWRERIKDSTWGSLLPAPSVEPAGCLKPGTAAAPELAFPPAGQLQRRLALSLPVAPHPCLSLTSKPTNI